MNRNALVTLGLVVSGVSVVCVGGFSYAYLYNAAAIQALSSNSDGMKAVELNFTQVYNILGIVIASLGGITGITTTIMGWLKSANVNIPGLPNDMATIVAEVVKRIQGGDTSSVATFTAFVAGITAARVYFKGSPQEKDADKLLEQLLPLGAAVEWGKTK